MKIIAITTPKVTIEDTPIIKSLIDRGINTVHLRKPDSNIEECRKLLSELTDAQRAKIIIHDYPELYFEFTLKGIHINRNITNLPSNYNGFKTRSCHSIEELKIYKNNYDYLFLSPIFDSISKHGYKSKFSLDVLRKASDDGIIDEKIIALGGVTLDKIPYLKELNFGGGAMMGAIYNISSINCLKNIYSK